MNEKIKKSFEELSEKPLKNQLERALCDIKENPFAEFRSQRNSFLKITRRIMRYIISGNIIFQEHGDFFIQSKVEKQ